MGLHRAILLMATLCIAMMPSIYRGGAETPHPHSVFQFWIAGPERAFNHHHDDEHDHGDHAHGVACGAGDDDAHVGACGTDAPVAIVQVDDPDTPRVSPSAHPGGSMSAIAIALGLAAMMLIAAESRLWRWVLVHPRRDWLSVPEPPPPRRAALPGRKSEFAVTW